MYLLDQAIAVIGGAGGAYGFAVCIQRGQQHAQHVSRQICLASGQAQALFGVEYLQFVAIGQ
ncbi:hypothetical protein D3C75_1170890 [compost metagenome]